MKKNKKYYSIAIIVVLSILVIASLFITDSNEKTSSSLSEDVDVILANAEKESAAITENEKKEFTNINVATYLEYYQGTDNKIIFVGRPTCPYCQLAQPIVQKLAKDYELEIFYLNTDEFQDEDEANFIKSDEYLNDGYGTPILLIVSNNSIVDMVDGATDTAHYKEFFKKNNYLN